MTDPKEGAEALSVSSMSAAFTVGDIGASVAWYRDVVGFQVEETWENEGKMVGAAVAAEGVRLFLMQDDWAKGRDRVKGGGFRLHLSTTTDVDQIAAGIEERGGTLESPPTDMPWGGRAFSVADPDGFKITISTER